MSLRAVYLQPHLLRLEARRRLLLAGHPARAEILRQWFSHPDRARFFELAGFLPPAGVPAPAGFAVPGTLDGFAAVLPATVVDALVLLPLAVAAPGFTRP